MSETHAEVEISPSRRVMTIWLNRPRARNALSDLMRAQVLRAVAQAQSDPEIRAVVVRGRGGHFSAGGDVKAMGKRTPAQAAARIFDARMLIDSIRNLNVPVIAAVEGYAVGAGWGLALACDIIVASSDAKFQMAFVKRGLAPDSATSYFVTNQVGLYRAKDIFLSGRVVPVSEAHDLGLVSRVWDTGDFDGQVMKLAEEVADGPTVSLALTKRVIEHSARADFATAWDIESLAAALSGTTDDHHAARTAWLEKRDVTFKGE